MAANQGETYAQFKGDGMVHGALDPNGNAYKFMLWAGNSTPDTSASVSGGKTPAAQSTMFTTTVLIKRLAAGASWFTRVSSILQQ